MSSGAADAEENRAHPTGERVPEQSKAENGLRIRAADAYDVNAIARLLVQAFPSLYSTTFGNLGTQKLTALLSHLYVVGTLSKETTLVAEREGRIVGLAILHFGNSIGRGSVWTFGLLLLRRLNPFQAVRAFFGGLCANAMLDRRIPRAPDLAYVEALAVAEGERGKGIGTHLLEEALTQAKARGRSRMALHVLQSNTRARHLYERIGFRPWERTPPRRSSGALFSRRASGWSALLLVRPI